MTFTKYSLRPRVTVIMTVLNPKLTVHTINSILGQRFDNFELWIVSRQCEAEVEEVLAGFCDDRIFHVDINDDRSDFEAYQEGVKRARAEYIACIEEGVLWLPNHLELLVEYIARTNVKVACSRFKEIFTGKSNGNTLTEVNKLVPVISFSIHKKEWANFFLAKACQPQQAMKEDFHAVLSFDIVPVTTGLKFFCMGKDDELIGLQNQYSERFRSDPDFINRELSLMLLDIEITLSQLSLGRLLRQLIKHYARKVKLQWTKAGDPSLGKLPRNARALSIANGRE